MNKILVLFFSLILFLGACSNDLQLFDERKDIPIVYGLISNSDTAHYLRVERAFADPNRSALEVSLIPDSLYYQNAMVSLLNVNSGAEFFLDMVDGNAEGYVRDQGVFAEAPNYLYKINAEEINLEEGQEYEFRLNRSENLPLVTARTKVLESPLITRPSSSGRLDFDYAQNFNVRWRGGDDAKLFDLRFILYYDETDLSLPDNPTTTKSLTWFVSRNIEQDEVEKLGIEFYSVLANSLEVRESLVRVFRHIDVLVDSGGQELLDYIRIGQANLGITSSQDIPTFTNLSEGLGLFSSRSTGFRLNVGITTETRDSLENGFITKDLNFN